MYMHQAMKEPDKDKFIAAMVEEMDAQLKGCLADPRVQGAKRRHHTPSSLANEAQAPDPDMGSLQVEGVPHIDGSHQAKGCNSWDTYAPVATWGSIWLVLAKAIIQGWHSKQIDFVMAYTQAPVKRDMYMEILKDFEVEGDGDGDYVLQIHKNIYGQKQAGCIWNKHLVGKLKSIRFCQCQSKECMFTQGKAIYVLYTDDSILTGLDLKELDKIINDMKKVGLDLTVEGDISVFLCINIQHHSDGTVHLTQPHLIDSILEELGLVADSAKSKATPAASSKLLGCHDDASPHDEDSFHCR